MNMSHLRVAGHLESWLITSDIESSLNRPYFSSTVEGGQRAIIFSRLGGIQEDIMSEGLHFRLPWFQSPIIYDIRSRPRKISSPTGSKDLQVFFSKRDILRDGRLLED